MESKEFLSNLEAHIPKGALELVWPLIMDYDFTLTVTNERKTKHGDYRMPMTVNQPHKISVNGTLNQYAFLLTFIHEVAHMHAFEKYGRRIKPHGIQWKRIFIKLANPFLKKDIWPIDILEVLINYFKNPKASSAGDSNLTRVLRSYDNNQDLYLEDVAEGSLFAVNSANGRWFEKGAKRRTRYLCIELETKRNFTIHGMAKVFVKE